MLACATCLGDAAHPCSGLVLCAAGPSPPPLRRWWPPPSLPSRPQSGEIAYESAKELHWFAVFYRTGSVIFGGGQVVLPMLYNDVVDQVCVHNEVTQQEVSGAGSAVSWASPGCTVWESLPGNAGREGGRGGSKEA